MQNKKIWYAVQKDREDDWGTGSFDYNEAVEMCKNDDRYTLIVAIDGDYDDNGIEHTEPIAIAEYIKGVDF